MVLSSARVTIGGGEVVLDHDATTGIGVAWAQREPAPLSPARSLRCTFALDGFARGLAIARTKPHWTSPCFVSDPRLVPSACHLLVWQTTHLPKDVFLAMIPLCGASLVGRLGFEDFALGVTLDAGAPGVAPSRAPLFAVGSGVDPAALVADLVRVGLEASGVRGRPRTAKSFPSPLARLGWCSWNAFGKEVSRAKVEDAVHELRASGVPLGFVLVDDGWQELEGDRLAGLDADQTKFPGGMRELTRALAPLDVGVWHSLHGYWGGTTGELAPRFPSAYHEHLAAAGVRFVKVDNQAATARLPGDEPLLDRSQALHAELDASATEAFGAPNVIDCMAMTLDNASSWAASSVVRTSDDYLPDTPDNVQEHIHQNAYNTLWGAAFAWPDWDMFQTHDAHAVTHAIARAVSGGPVYVTDDARRTRREVLERLALADGTVLRPDEPGQVVRRLLLRDPSLEPIPLLVGARVSRPGARAAVIGAFHVNKAEEVVEDAIEAEDLLALGLTLPAVLAATGSEERAVFRVDRGGRVPVRLSARGAQLFVASSIEQGSAPIGRADKYVAPAAIVRCERTPEGLRLVVSEPGPVAAWIERDGVGALETAHGADVTLG